MYKRRRRIHLAPSGGTSPRSRNVTRERMVAAARWRIFQRHGPDLEAAAHGKCESSGGVEGPVARRRQPARDLLGPFVELAREIGLRHARSGTLVEQFQDSG